MNRTQNTPIETYARHETDAKRRNRTASLQKERPHHGAPFRITNPGRNSVGITAKKRKPEVNPQSPITAPTLENAPLAIPTCGIETQDIASRPVWRSAANSRREPNAKHHNRNALAAQTGSHAPNSEFRIAPPFPPRALTPVPELKPAKRSLSPAHNSLSYNPRQR